MATVDFGEIGGLHDARIEVMGVNRKNSNHISLGIVALGMRMEVSIYLADVCQMDALLLALPKAEDFCDYDVARAAREAVPAGAP